MKLRSITIAFAVSVWTVSAQAHDPSMHKEKAEKPDCAAMENMDHSKMDANDPVMQAMMKKCMGQIHQGDQSAHGNSENAAQDSQEK